MLTKAKTKKLPPLFVLGSSSPRRIEMLTALGLKFKIIKPDVEERVKRSESPANYVKRNSITKAHWVAEKICSSKVYLKQKECLVLSADTIVVLGGKILEKPRDRKHAAKMLNMLSGRTHKVITAFSIFALKKSLNFKKANLNWKIVKKITKTVYSDVTFKKLSVKEIKDYIATGEPDDKAGAYAVQGIGSYIVKSIKGSYTNVVGLPLTEVVESSASILRMLNH